ncbi:conjugal transfer protein TrbG/VirB9/CagX [Caballeronia arationis]|nr:conjugal transfer protein TrbG/VirB9/CagX [Caballeronia arationis]
MVAGDPMSPINPFNGGADPLTMPGDARIGVFPYSRDQIYRVLTAPLKLTTIELEKGEKLIADPAMGDSVQWEIDDDKMNHVFIKPHKADLVNTLHLTTNLREYDFTLIASPAGGMFYQTVRFQYPRAPMARASARDDATANSARGGADSGSISVAPDKLNWDYSVDGRAEFTPETVFDDTAMRSGCACLQKRRSGRFRSFSTTAIASLRTSFAAGTSLSSSVWPTRSFCVPARTRLR